MSSPLTPRPDEALKSWSGAPTRPMRRQHARWTTLLNGRIYRPTMRLMHRLGWCYPERTLMGDGSVWCHWCGMRGKGGLTPEYERLVERALADDGGDRG